ncbi:Ig-like domain-containing protein, partial [Brevibacillus sp. SYSU BS000544]|uniref:Ig-like domain-containing protein n=1 Tax=Brevibacillus sp. SYSU BS000544 TaxID=3416443 RepID=UPI003CE580AC
NNGATGNDSFTFRVYDGKVYSNTATVAVSIEPPTPSNQVPTAQNDSFATTVNTPVSGILRASDPDSDPLTYSIDQNGTKGTATITNSTTGAFTYVPNAGETGNDSFTFRVNDGHSSSNLATISITISNSTPPPYYPVTDVILDKTRVELQAGGEPITLHATIKPSNASNQQVIWSSSNQLVASVDQQGKVTPLMAGEAVITVTSLDRNISDICRIVVKAQTTPVTKIVLDKTNVDTEEYGTPFKIKATVFPENATNQKIVWSSSNEKVAVVDQTGNVTPLAKGTAIIKAKTEDRNKEAKCVVKVKKGQLVGIEVPEQNLHLVINKTKVLKVYATLNDGSKKDITKEKETTIENLSPDLVTIKKNVIKAGKNEGIAKIKVTYKNQTTTFNVIVSKVGVSKLIASDKEVSLGKGESKQISVQALLTDKTSIPVTELATWSSDQSDIVSVKAGVITAHKKGTAKMKAIYGGKNVTITVKVK